MKAVLEKFSDVKFEIIVYGTPAEEGLGGKVVMIEKGVFDEVDLAMMSHPTPFEIPVPYWLARVQLTVVFTGLKGVHSFCCMDDILLGFVTWSFWLILHHSNLCRFFNKRTVTIDVFPSF